MAESELTTIARPYARAAFASAREKRSGLQKWSKMLNALGSVVSERVVVEKLDDPKLTTEEASVLFEKLLGRELNKEGRNFINVLAEYGRLELLPIIAYQYELLKAEYEKTVNVEVISAYKITKSEEKQLSDALHAKLQRDVSLTTRVDETLLGGAVIKAEDTVIDGSILGKLRKLSQALQ